PSTPTRYSTFNKGIQSNFSTNWKSPLEESNDWITKSVNSNSRQANVNADTLAMVASRDMPVTIAPSNGKRITRLNRGKLASLMLNYYPCYDLELSSMRHAHCHDQQDVVF